jgi:SAM-dependent methyltransferase
VAEVGAGIGTFSERLLAHGVDELLLVEPEQACVRALHERYDARPGVTVSDELLPDSPLLKANAGALDFVLCQNVLEHIPDDLSAVRAMADTLRPGGVVTILVPAHPRLYGPLDEAYEHARRYTPERLAWLAGAAGLTPLHVGHFNALGILGWWTKNRLSPEPRLDPRSLRVYERLLKVWRPIEDRVTLPFGLSVILHAERG